MEQSIERKTYPELESNSLRLRLSPLMTCVFIMLVGFTVVMLGMRSLAQYMPSPPNPFPAYAGIFPRQPASAISSWDFSCWSIDSSDYHDPTQESCIFTPAEGVFSKVEVVTARGTIQKLTFILRDNSLQVGDLELLLKIPTIHIFYHVVYFFLPESLVIVETSDHSAQFSRFLPVSTISFTDINLLT